MFVHSKSQVGLDQAADPVPAVPGGCFHSLVGRLVEEYDTTCAELSALRKEHARLCEPVEAHRDESSIEVDPGSTPSTVSDQSSCAAEKRATVKFIEKGDTSGSLCEAAEAPGKLEAVPIPLPGTPTPTEHASVRPASPRNSRPGLSVWSSFPGRSNGGLGRSQKFATEGFLLRQAWTRPSERGKSLLPSETCNDLAIRSTSLALANDMEFNPEAMVTLGGARRFGFCGLPVVFPSSPWVLTWDSFGALLIIYDLITIPMMLCFDIPRSTFGDTMDWTTLIFWTVNIGMTLHVGYFEQGQFELEARKIALRYVKTWMPIDLIVLVPDWVFSFMTSMTSGASSEGAESLKLLRLARLVRMARLVRLVKLNIFFQKINDQIDSEYVSITTHIAKMMMVLVTINHIIACIFFALSVIYEPSDSYQKWIDVAEIADAPWIYQYMVSYHWSFAQFTPAPNDVQPQNPLERAFAITVLIFALLGFAYVVGSITGSLAQLRAMQERTSKMFWNLRRYLKQHKVPLQLSSRIQRYLAHAWANQQNEGLVKEAAIWQLLSEQLRSELQCELAERHLRIHPFFCGLSDISKMTMNRMAVAAVKQKAMAKADSLFIRGEKATHMYIVSSGCLQYLRIDINGVARHERVQKGQDWISEPVLWVEAWEHLGGLVAESHCELCLVSPREFADTVSLSPVAYGLSRSYARGYFKWLNSVPVEDHSDIAQGEDVYDMHAGFLHSGGQAQLTNLHHGLSRTFSKSASLNPFQERSRSPSIDSLSINAE